MNIDEQREQDRREFNIPSIYDGPVVTSEEGKLREEFGVERFYTCCDSTISIRTDGTCVEEHMACDPNRGHYFVVQNWPPESLDEERAAHAETQRELSEAKKALKKLKQLWTDAYVQHKPLEGFFWEVDKLLESLPPELLRTFRHPRLDTATFMTALVEKMGRG